MKEEIKRIEKGKEKEMKEQSQEERIYEYVVCSIETAEFFVNEIVTSNKSIYSFNREIESAEDFMRILISTYEKGRKRICIKTLKRSNCLRFSGISMISKSKNKMYNIFYFSIEQLLSL